MQNVLTSLFLEGFTVLPRLASSLGSFCLAPSSGIKGLEHHALLSFVNILLSQSSNELLLWAPPIPPPLPFFPLVLG